MRVSPVYVKANHAFRPRICCLRLAKLYSMRSIRQWFEYLSDKRFSTLAGTLVYFLLMSITPFMFWLTLVFGNVDLSFLTSNGLFAAVMPVIGYLQEAAQSATAGAGVLLALTSLWSSTNFFYHLRRSGEIIYEAGGKKGGLRLRLSSIVVVFASLVLISIAATLPFFSYGYLSLIMPAPLSQGISLVFTAMLALIIAYLLNIFACPYRLPFSLALSGSVLTVTLWLVCAAGFTVYLQFANLQRLYGAIAAVIVFLLWAYLMVNSLVIGMIYNGKFLADRRIKTLF